IYPKIASRLRKAPVLPVTPKFGSFELLESVRKRLFEEIDGALGSATRHDDFLDSLLQEQLTILIGNHASTEHEDIACAFVIENLNHFGKQGHVRARQNRKPDSVHVFLYCGFHNLFGRAMKSG